jgi:hypothetical protein
MSLYEYAPHPQMASREGPVKVADLHPTGSPFARFNTRFGLAITTLVGTMVCAYIFTLIALISLPSAIKSGNLTVIIAWVSSNFIQLVLLPIIIVGQNVQAAASDKRSEQTYKDAEALLAEAIKIQEHLAAQDQALVRQREDLENQAVVLRQIAQAVGSSKLTQADGA